MPDSWSTLHDVAFLYLFLAAEADGTLDEAEEEAIVALLRRRVPSHPEPDIRRVVAEADMDRQQPNGRNVRSVIEGLKYAQMNDAQRSAMLDDLVQVAHADGTIHRGETGFIRSLARTWDIDLPANLERAVHDLALVYLFMALGSNGTLNKEEHAAVTDQLAQWQPSLRNDAVQAIVRNAVRTLQHDTDNRHLTDAIAAIKKGLPLAPQRRAVLNAVMHIAQADGHLSQDELDFFLKLTDELELA
ncbi:MAG TPA: TerB family tellurite resistance protein [Rhodothermales bacterium]|nr:TerB family tellurite resistance protein [Rhodothermales bacterium]